MDVSNHLDNIIHAGLYFTDYFFSLHLWLRTYLLLPKKHIPFFLPSDNIKFGWKEIECHKKRKEKHEDIKSSFPKLGMKSAETECVECEDNKKQEFVTFKRSLKNNLSLSKQHNNRSVSRGGGGHCFMLPTF